MYDAKREGTVPLDDVPKRGGCGLRLLLSLCDGMPLYDITLKSGTRVLASSRLTADGLDGPVFYSRSFRLCILHHAVQTIVETAK